MSDGGSSLLEGQKGQGRDGQQLRLHSCCGMWLREKPAANADIALGTHCPKAPHTLPLCQGTETQGARALIPQVPAEKP